jgi:hypothetical protein
MTISTSYSAVSGGVTISASSAPAAAQTAYFQRSLDGITWTDVRGGQAVPIVTSAASVVDYEFQQNTTNIYRVSWVDATTVTARSNGAVSRGNNATLSPAMPAGAVVGDLVILTASINNVAATVNTPTGYTLAVDLGNVRVFVRRFVSGDTSPSVSFTGGAAGNDTQAFLTAIRNADANLAAQSTLSNVSAQNVNYPGLTMPATSVIGALVTWKASSSTSYAPATTVFDSSTSGTGATLTQAGLTGTLAASSYVVTGGVSAVSKALAYFYAKAAFVTQETTNYVDAHTDIWLVHPTRPYLNRSVLITQFGDVQRKSRAGLYPIIGRTFNVAVTDVKEGRAFSVTITTTTRQAEIDLDLTMALGEPIYLRTPLNGAIPSVYVAVGDQAVKHTSYTHPRRFFEWPLTEVAQPNPLLVANNSTWQDVVNTYATWTTLLAAKATWADLLATLGTPTSTIVS